MGLDQNSFATNALTTLISKILRSAYIRFDQTARHNIIRPKKVAVVIYYIMYILLSLMPRRDDMIIIDPDHAAEVFSWNYYNDHRNPFS